MIHDVNVLHEDTGEVDRYYGVQVIGNPSYLEIQDLTGKILQRIVHIKIMTFDLYKIIVTGSSLMTPSGVLPEYDSQIWTLSKSSK